MAAPTPPRISTSLTDTTAFALVAIPRATSLTLYLDRFRTNEPVAGATLEVETPEPAMVEGDPDRLHQVVANLVSNAVKFSAGRSPVRIATSAADREVELTVRDEGTGIAAEDLPKLFQRFVRIPQPGEQDRIPGTGLGLYISRTIVLAHHGRIWAESSPGHGSIFHVALPAAG